MLSLDALLADTALQLTLAAPGPAGSTRQEVLWLHNTELPDPSPYIRPTELVLTNGLWRDTVSASRFVAALQRARASGLIFGLTEQTPSLPTDLVDSCAAAGIPLASLSIAVPFTAVTEAAARIQGEGRQNALAGLVDAATPWPPRSRAAAARKACSTFSGETTTFLCWWWTDSGGASGHRR